MGEISILRPRRNLVSIPVVEAVYCESCASVSNSIGGCCAVCGNITVWPLAELVPRPPNSPGPKTVTTLQSVPVSCDGLPRAA